MKLACISDTHNQQFMLQMPEADILVHTGDWTGRGREWETTEFLKWLNEQKYKHKVFIAGNHDFYPETHPEQFKELLAKYAPTCTYLENSAVVIEGYRFYGSPVSPWFHDWAFNAQRGAEIQSYWDKIPDDTEVLLTHGPVFGYGDKLSKYGSEPGKNVGCQNLLSTIDSRLKDLQLHVSGHIHEGAGLYKHFSPHGEITLVNASMLDEHYNLAQAPFIIELPTKS